MSEPAAAGTDRDARDLASFGYAQQLRRGLGSFASFAAGFSFISILTTVFQLFFLGFSFGGAAFFWTWPIVFAGQLMVALCFAELAAQLSDLRLHLPVVAKRLSNPTYGWFAGWMMLIAPDRHRRRGGDRAAGRAAVDLGRASSSSATTRR